MIHRLCTSLLTFIVAVLFAGCGPTTSTQGKPANVVNTTTAKAADAAPSKESLMSAEIKAWESWKAKDGRYFEEYLSDNNFVAVSGNGRIDKATVVRRHVDPACEVNTFALSDERMTLLSPDVALITYKAKQDAKCGGKALPSPVWAATVLVRNGAAWKAAYHNENAVVDPNTLSAKKTGHKEPPATEDAKTTPADENTEDMVNAEKAVWEAWKDHDGKRIDMLTAGDISFINIFGTFLPDKAEAIKNWTSSICQVKSVSVTEAVATMLTPTVGILTFKGGADGLCGG